jgi:hypothetical protein
MKGVVMPVVRGCGTRVAGGLYLATHLSKGGKPLEEFLVDPPHVIDPKEYGVTPLGVSIHEWYGTYHVFDWVGSEFYPDVASFVEEVRRFGASRHVTTGPGLHLELLTRDSRLVLIHERAGIRGPAAYNAQRPHYRETLGLGKPFRQPYCPMKKAAHQGGDPGTNCIGLCWEDLEDRDGVDRANDPDLDARAVYVTQPSFEYRAALRPEGVTPKYAPAIFMTLPIHTLEFVTSDEPEHQERLQKLRARKLGFTIEEVDQ